MKSSGNLFKFLFTAHLVFLLLLDKSSQVLVYHYLLTSYFVDLTLYDYGQFHIYHFLYVITNCDEFLRYCF